MVDSVPRCRNRLDSASTSGRRVPNDELFNTSPAPAFPKPLDHDPFSDHHSTRWTDGPIVESPQTAYRLFSPSNSSASTLPTTKSQASKSTTSGYSSDNTDSGVPRASSKVRWERLRRNVVPSPVPLLASPPLSSQNLPTVGSPVLLPSKHSRFPRLGLRQVVDHVREVAAKDQRVFSDDLLSISWPCRLPDVRAGRHEREGTAGVVVSSLHLPFISGYAHASAAASSTGSLLAQSGRHPSSPEMLVTSQHAAQIMMLHETILRSASRNASYLPHEHLVLGLLSKPFSMDQQKRSTQEEQLVAIETFEIAVNTWRPASPEVGVGRCIWCCNAARSPTSMRSRIIGVLESLLFPRTGPIEFCNPGTFLSLTQSLLLTLVALMQDSPNGQDLIKIKDLITQLRSGRCGSLAAYLASAEMDGVSVMLDGVSEAQLRDALVSEALVRCCQYSPSSIKNQFAALVEEYWKPRSQLIPFVPLLAAIHARKLFEFSYVMSLFVCDSSMKSHTGTPVITHILESRVNKEVMLIDEKRSMDVMKRIIWSLLQLLCLDTLSREDTDRIFGLLSTYFTDSQWRSAVEAAVREVINDRDWPIVCQVVEAFFMLTESVRDSLLVITISLLHQRVGTDPPTYPAPPLTSIFAKASRFYPRVFFRPLFACAASSKEQSVVPHLLQLIGISAFLPDYWMCDPDMVVVALMKGAENDQATRASAPKTRLGQTALLVELIMALKVLNSSDAASIPQFLSMFESRLGAALEATLRTTSLPPLQLLLLSVLLKEIRLNTRSLKRSPWLLLSIQWLLQSSRNVDIDGGDASLHEDNVDLHELATLYQSAQQALRLSHQNPRVTLIHAGSSGGISAAGEEPQSKISTLLTERIKFIASLSPSLTHAIVRLLVVVSSSLVTEDYDTLGPYLWKHSLDNASSPSTVSAAFLIMSCAEKAPTSLMNVITADLQSDDEGAQVAAIRRFDNLINLRFQILSQQFLQDKHRRRPFRLARDPLPFVATTMGSNLPVHEEQGEDQDGMPVELRKRLADVGWFLEKEPVGQKQERVRTPLSLLPLPTIYRLVHGEHQSFLSSPIGGQSSNADGPSGLTARSSDISNRMSKRRAVFVPSLAPVFAQLVLMASASSAEVAFAARDSIFHVLRDDPGLVLRPTLDLLAKTKVDVAIKHIRGLLCLRNVLPPAAAHYLFNHLMGYLKGLTREIESRDPLFILAECSAVLADLAAQVKDMSLREIRRAKVEAVLLSTGSLWFTEAAPTYHMFSRTLAEKGDATDRLSTLTALTMVRMSQNQLLLTLLKRHPQDVQVIRKSMKGLELPTLDDRHGGSSPLTLDRLSPSKRRPSEVLPPSHRHIHILSSLLSRSYLMLVTQTFISMPRNICDRNELATFIDGINRILLAHGSDAHIVTQALIALLTASTRFRRLFTSGAGYPLFILAIIKVYVEQDGNRHIRQAIEYTVNRFYALHQEAFLFQTLDTVGHVVMTEECDGPWTMTQVHQLLGSLHLESTFATSDASCIRDSTKVQEKEAVMFTAAEEKPQAFAAAVRHGGTSEKKLVIDLPEEYASVTLLPENTIRLLLTVIAHDPSIYRAQHFLRLLRLSVRPVYVASKAARTVLRDGIDAIGSIVMRTSSKGRGPELAPLSMGGSLDAEALSEDLLVNSLQTKSKSPSDAASMRLDFLYLVLEYLQCGGQVLATISEKFFDATRTLLREATHQDNGIAQVLCQYTKGFLDKTGQQNSKGVIGLLESIASIIQAHGSTIDFADIYDAITPIISETRFTNDVRVLQSLVTHVVRAGLEAQLSRCTDRPSFPPTNSPLITLMAKVIYIHGADVIAEVERHPASYQILTGILLPLVLSLTSGSFVGSHEPRHPDIRRNIWMRLLSYALNALQNPSQASLSSSFLERRKSQDKRRSDYHDKDVVMVITVSLQILKIVCVKAEEDISLALPGIWGRLAEAFRSLLEEGDASFALKGADSSAQSSPTHSPRQSVASFDPFSDPVVSLPFDTQTTLDRSPRPRLVDYLLWSLLELVCSCRGPLMLQFRGLIQRKARCLDQDFGARQNIFSPGLQERRASSIFSKPRKPLSNMGFTSTPPMSPSAPRLTIPTSPWESPSHVEDVNFTFGRRAGFERSPTSSPGGVLRPLQIIHLGPTESREPHRSTSSTATTRMLLKSTTVRSLKLVHATYRRIRLVQTSMGYDSLLPLPAGMEAREEDSQPRAWTKLGAIKALVREMGELAEEFTRSPELQTNDSVVIVDPGSSTA